MGVSLAHLNSTVGLDTVLVGRPNSEHLHRAHETVAASYAREVRRGRQTQAEAESGMARLEVSGDFAALADCDAVFESVYEILDSKRQIMAEIEAITAPRCVHLSTTSSIPAAMLAAELARPGRVIVTHYIWPAHRRNLVEMTAPDFVESDAMERALALLRRQGKQPFLVKDTPGFVITRVLTAYWSEVLYLVRDGATPHRIDAALEDFGWPMGPCRLMDTVGIRTCTDAYAFLRPFLSERMDGLQLLLPVAEAGYIGSQAGKGFYIHEGPLWKPNQTMSEMIRSSSQEPPSEEECVDRTMGMMLNEAAFCIAEDVASDWKTMGEAIDEAFDFPKKQGGFKGYFDRLGVSELGNRLARWEQDLGSRFRSPDWAALPLERS